VLKINQKQQTTKSMMLPKETVGREEIAILILAAGPSSRLGQPKQQLLIDGAPLLIRTVATALGSNIGKVYVVIGYGEEAHRKLLSGSPVEIIVNPDWEKGMGSSLKAGLNFLLTQNNSLKGIVVMVCDQPLLTPTHLQQLTHTFKQTKSDIVASYYTGTAGVPALFSQALFRDLRLIGDTEGAKKIIQHNLHKTSTVPFEGGAIDIDTPEDYERLIKSKAG
jgi:molybdenum cofactor cytidylyltransferase